MGYESSNSVFMEEGMLKFGCEILAKTSIPIQDIHEDKSPHGYHHTTRL